jgi:hypothetical protein
MGRRKKIIEPIIAEPVKPAVEQKPLWSFAYYLGMFATEGKLLAAIETAGKLGLPVETLARNEEGTSGICRIRITDIETAAGIFPTTKLVKYFMPGHWCIYELCGESGERYGFRTDGMSQGIWSVFAEKQTERTTSENII